MEFDLKPQPDMATTESLQFAGGKVQMSVTSKQTGRTVYVRFESKKGAPRAWKRGTVPFAEFDRVFVSEKGYGTPRLGAIYPNGVFYTDRPANDPHVWAVRVICEFVSGLAAKETDRYTIEAESTCCLCSLPLEDPVSVARGIGPVCAKKPTGTKILHAAGEQLKLKIAAAADPGSPVDHLADRLAEKAEFAKREREQEDAAYVAKMHRDGLLMQTAQRVVIDMDDDGMDEDGSPIMRPVYAATGVQERKVREAISDGQPVSLVIDGIGEDETLDEDTKADLIAIARLAGRTRDREKMEGTHVA